MVVGCEAQFLLTPHWLITNHPLASGNRVPPQPPSRGWPKASLEPRELLAQPPVLFCGSATWCHGGFRKPRWGFTTCYNTLRTKSQWFSCAQIAGFIHTDLPRAWGHRSGGPIYWERSTRASASILQVPLGSKVGSTGLLKENILAKTKTTFASCLKGFLHVSRDLQMRLWA